MPSAPRHRPNRTMLLVVALVTVAASVAAVCLLTRAPGPSAEEFLSRPGDRFMLHGEPFAAAGTNNYRPMRGVRQVDRPAASAGLRGRGLLCDPSNPRAAAGQPGRFAYDCSRGVDAEAIPRIDEIDMVGMHLYPDHWRTTPEWSTEYISDHARLAAEVGKQLFMGEYGWRGNEPRSAVFHEWLTAFQAGGGDIALLRALAGIRWPGLSSPTQSPMWTDA